MSTIKTGHRASMWRSIRDPLTAQVPGVGVGHNAGSVEACENCLIGGAGSCICTYFMYWGHGKYSVPDS